MILRKGLCSKNHGQKKNFKQGFTSPIFYLNQSNGANEPGLSNSFFYFSDPVKIGNQI